jgi:hypothetical protein
LNDSNAVQPLPAEVDKFELPHGVKYHKGRRIYFVSFPEDDIKLEYRVKELGGEVALASALATEKQIRAKLS